MTTDLHTHSTAFHGQHMPIELAKIGVRLTALTDRDTVDGLTEEGQAGKGLDLRVFGGAELEAAEYSRFHID